jgi:pyruvate,water dikinase
MFKVEQSQLDNSQTPEVAALRSLQSLAERIRSLQPELGQAPTADLLARLAATPAGQSILPEFDRFLDEYGYLSEVGTDIAVPTWKEDDHPVQALLAQFVQHPPPASPLSPSRSRSVKWAQQRLDLKGHVTTCYSQLLAELRWSFVALEQQWLKSGLLHQIGDVFFLTFEEIEQIILDAVPLSDLTQSIAQRRAQFEQDRQLIPPSLVYGNQLPLVTVLPPARAVGQLQGIAASPGQAQGQVLVVRNFQDLPVIDRAIDRQTILVVPYTDSGWAALLARAGGLIAEVGGQLSHGAIVAREYGIPAVMNVASAMQLLQTGQSVQIDGSTGTVEILDEPDSH